MEEKAGIADRLTLEFNKEVKDIIRAAEVTAAQLEPDAERGTEEDGRLDPARRPARMSRSTGTKRPSRRNRPI